jgi:hypothetical protein
MSNIDFERYTIPLRPNLTSHTIKEIVEKRFPVVFKIGIKKSEIWKNGIYALKGEGLYQGQKIKIEFYAKYETTHFTLRVKSNLNISALSTAIEPRQSPINSNDCQIYIKFWDLILQDLGLPGRTDIGIPINWDQDVSTSNIGGGAPAYITQPSVPVINHRNPLNPSINVSRVQKDTYGVRPSRKNTSSRREALRRKAAMNKKAGTSNNFYNPNSTNLPKLTSSGPQLTVAQQEKLVNLFGISNKIRLEDLSSIVGINKTELFQVLMDKNSELKGFKIEGDYVIKEDVTAKPKKEDLSGFLEVLDDQFDDWGDKEKAKDGKIEDVTDFDFG